MRNDEKRTDCDGAGDLMPAAASPSATGATPQTWREYVQHKPECAVARHAAATARGCELVAVTTYTPSTGEVRTEKVPTCCTCGLDELLAGAPPAAQPTAPQWLSIDSAPKDGTPILVGTSRWFAVATYYDRESSRWWTWHPPIYGRREQVREANGLHYAERPTHWMPLPTAPAQEERCD